MNLKLSYTIERIEYLALATFFVVIDSDTGSECSVWIVRNIKANNKLWSIIMSSSGGARDRESIQKQIQQDWANREYIEVITGSIKKITDFLNSFGIFPILLHHLRLTSR